MTGGNSSSGRPAETHFWGEGGPTDAGGGAGCGGREVGEAARALGGSRSYGVGADAWARPDARGGGSVMKWLSRGATRGKTPAPLRRSWRRPRKHSGGPAETGAQPDTVSGLISPRATSNPAQTPASTGLFRALRPLGSGRDPPPYRPLGPRTGAPAGPRPGLPRRPSGPRSPPALTHHPAH